MILVGIDIETTGLNADTDEIFEIGIATYNTESKNILSSIGTLLKTEKEIPEEIKKICKVNESDLKSEVGLPLDFANYLIALREEGCFFVAHNAEFERSFLKKYGVDIQKKDWIDTMHDLPYPEDIKTRKLTHLCAEHEFINPFAHRAIFDVVSMLKLLSKYDIQDVMARQESPLLLIQAIVGYEAKDKAKEAGFYWDAPTKRWLKKIKECDLLKMNYEFRYEVQDDDKQGTMF